jgi:hypothetical protein
MKKLKIVIITYLFFIFISPVIYASSCYVTNNIQTGDVCFDASDLILNQFTCNSIAQQDTTVTASFSASSCPSTGQVCKVNINESDIAFSISYYNFNMTQADCNSINGIFSGTTNTITPTPVPTAQIQTITGQTLSATLVDLATPTTTSDTVSDVSAVVTLKDSGTTIKRDDGSIIEVKQETIAVLNPSIQTTNTITLIRGEVTATVDCSQTSDYVVRTSIANIRVPGSCTSNQRASDTSAVFTSNYSQNGLDGTLTVKVVTGTVNVTDRKGEVFTLTNGDEKVIQSTVPRTSWVLPIDGDQIYGGKTNMLVWTKYPNASNYLLEYNLPSPVFAQENASNVEDLKKSFLITSASYIEYDDLITFSIPLSTGLDGTIVEARIFALDASGNIIGESVSSDRTTVTWRDL